jgi:hypothetical protein
MQLKLRVEGLWFGEEDGGRRTERGTDWHWVELTVWYRFHSMPCFL